MAGALLSINRGALGRDRDTDTNRIIYEVQKVYVCSGIIIDKAYFAGSGEETY
jgi:hypothetical protein